MATIKFYQKNYERLIDFLENDNLINVSSINDITSQTIEEYRLHLLDKDISNNSVNTYLRGIRTFLYYAMELNYLEDFFIKTI